MLECCEDQENQVSIERWLADGFWELYGEVTGYVERHKNQSVAGLNYYEKAVSRVFDLASWYFSGTNPFLPGTDLEPL